MTVESQTYMISGRCERLAGGARTFHCSRGFRQTETRIGQHGPSINVFAYRLFMSVMLQMGIKKSVVHDASALLWFCSALGGLLHFALSFIHHFQSCLRVRTN